LFHENGAERCPIPRVETNELIQQQYQTFIDELEADEHLYAACCRKADEIDKKMENCASLDEMTRDQNGCLCLSYKTIERGLNQFNAIDVYSAIEWLIAVDADISAVRRAWSQMSFGEKTIAPQELFVQPATAVTVDAKSSNYDEQASSANEVPSLSEKQYLILEAMKELDAISADRRWTCERIAVRCDGTEAELSVFKPLLSDLKTHGLVDSKTGRGGGSWLTTKGNSVAETLLRNRQSPLAKQ
jgi:hypothetical protein